MTKEIQDVNAYPVAEKDTSVSPQGSQIMSMGIASGTEEVSRCRKPRWSRRDEDGLDIVNAEKRL